MTTFACSTVEAVQITASDGVHNLQECTSWIAIPDDQSQNPFDYTYAAGIWAVAFGMVVAFYFASHPIALILNFIRRG